MISDAIQTGRSLSKGSRPQNSIYSGLLALLAARSQGTSTFKCLICYGLVLLLYALATNFNNVSDLQTDILNKRTDNPLTSGSLTRHELILFSGLCLLAVITLQLSLRQPMTAILTALYLVLSYAYSDSFFRLKSRGLLGTVLLCACYGVLPLLLGFAQGSRTNSHLIVELALLVPLSLAPLLLAKDYKDYKGDKETHKQTPLIRFGYKNLFLLANSVALIAVAMYGVLALEHHKNTVVVGFIAASYFLLMWKLHKSQGTILRPYRTALLITLLAMPVSILYSQIK